MSRVKRGTTTHARHRKVIKLAKGYRGRSKNCFRLALQRVEKALQYAYRDRKKKKIDFRRLWIVRINAAVRQYGLTYSKFISQLAKKNYVINRKMLADMAVFHQNEFKQLVDKVAI